MGLDANVALTRAAKLKYDMSATRQHLAIAKLQECGNCKIVYKLTKTSNIRCSRKRDEDTELLQ